MTGQLRTVDEWQPFLKQYSIDLHPGLGERYASFADLVVDERESFEDLRRPCLINE